MATAAIIPAAGLGTRLADGVTAAVPKAFREVGGESLLVHAIRGLCAATAADLSCCVVALPSGFEDVDLNQHAPDVDVVCVAGGKERTDSVRLALEAVPLEGIDCILVHDAARPFVPAEVVERVVLAVRNGAPAVVPVIPVTDTIKRVDADGKVVDTPERRTLVAVQTPQGFDPEVLRKAHAVGADATDDAALCERLGVPVVTVEGSEDAFKITRPRDLLLAEALLAARQAR